jgi:hypothetical protein
MSLNVPNQRYLSKTTKGLILLSQILKITPLQNLFSQSLNQYDPIENLATYRK